MNDMKTYRLRVMQNVKQWYGMPMDIEVEATDPAAAIVRAWDDCLTRGIAVKDIHLLTP
jgi:hypothetical protein